MPAGPPTENGEMSEERLEALGLPRREFLKRAAALGVFAAPVIVSFGLSGTAEAAPGCFPNQNFANQASTIGDAVLAIWQDEQFDRIQPGYARQLRQKFLDLEGKLLDENVKASCQRLESLAASLNAQKNLKIAFNTADKLLTYVYDVQSDLGCDSC